jgi:hypothetical protein
VNPWKLGVGIAVAVLAGVPAGWAILDQDSEASNGPLDGGEGRVDGQPVNVDDPYTMGSVLLVNNGDKPVEIEKVQLLGVHGPMKTLGVLSRAWPPATGPALSAGEEDYPPVSAKAEPLAELNVVPIAKTRTEAGTPGEGIQLFFGVQITEPGIAWAERVEVTYKVGGKRYREQFDRAFVLCAPFDAYGGAERPCPPPEVDEQLPF